MSSVVCYYDGEMSPGRRNEFREHLETCPDCRARLRAAEAALGTFDALIHGEPLPLDMAEAMASLRRGEMKARAARLGLKVIKGKR